MQSRLLSKDYLIGKGVMEGMKPISSWDMKLGRHSGSRNNVVSMMHKVGDNAMKEGQKTIQ